MARNFVQPGNTITLTAPSAVASGEGLAVGQFFGIAVTDAEAGAQVEAALTGVFELPKAAVAVSQGDALYWDAGASNLTTTATGNTLIGAATETAATGAATARVRLNGVAT